MWLLLARGVGVPGRREVGRPARKRNIQGRSVALGLAAAAAGLGRRSGPGWRSSRCGNLHVDPVDPRALDVVVQADLCRRHGPLHRGQRGHLQHRGSIVVAAAAASAANSSLARFGRLRSSLCSTNH
eukprot:scaffold11_cov257-Pinguiococcus_pyrenoidosus.AAC.4